MLRELCRSTFARPLELLSGPGVLLSFQKVFRLCVLWTRSGFALCLNNALVALPLKSPPYFRYEVGVEVGDRKAPGVVSSRLAYFRRDLDVLHSRVA